MTSPLSSVIKLSCKTAERYSPPKVVDRARRLMGDIDLDPASCREANDNVRARRIYTAADDGLTQSWFGRVFLNPPGGKLKFEGGRWVPIAEGKVRGESSMRIWWDRLVEAWQAGDVTEAVFVGFTLEILRTSQRCAMPVQKFPRCYPSSRIVFAGSSRHNPHSNVLVYLPKKGRDGFSRFAKAFGDIGFCEAGAK